jgi:hypothetical protein
MTNRAAASPSGGRPAGGQAKRWGCVNAVAASNRSEPDARTAFQNGVTDPKGRGAHASRSTMPSMVQLMRPAVGSSKPPRVSRRREEGVVTADICRYLGVFLIKGILSQLTRGQGG